jgi:Helicase HerA, central domain
MQEKTPADRTSDAHLADKLYMETNLLRIAGALFCHDQKVAGKRTAEIELNAGVIEKHISIRPNPKLGQPGPLAHKIFVALIKKRLPRPMEPEQPSIAITATGTPVHFSREERERHVYVVGKSGSGKSTLVFNLAMLDIVAGEGVAIIDPHGDLAEMVADCTPPDRTHETCYLDVTDTELPIGFNPLAGVTPARQALAAPGIVSAFKHLWADSWGPRLEHWLFQGLRRSSRRNDRP